MYDAPAFSAINKLFGEVFFEMNGGGNASLNLTDENDILSGGVEVKVRMPNKKTQELTMLSGGERALTVIALLFAAVKFKPHSICVMDEIDAALDEANLSRFGSYLQKISENGQIIVITHRKGTMAYMSGIYGVAKSPDGFTKILSIDRK